MGITSYRTRDSHSKQLTNELVVWWHTKLSFHVHLFRILFCVFKTITHFSWISILHEARAQLHDYMTVFQLLVAITRLQIKPKMSCWPLQPHSQKTKEPFKKVPSLFKIEVGKKTQKGDYISNAKVKRLWDFSKYVAFVHFSCGHTCTSELVMAFFIFFLQVHINYTAYMQ